MARLSGGGLAHDVLLRCIQTFANVSAAGPGMASPDRHEVDQGDGPLRPCRAGWAPTGEKDDCAPCPISTYSATGASCVACLPGRVTWRAGSHSAEQCVLATEKEEPQLRSGRSRRLSLSAAGATLWAAVNADPQLSEFAQALHAAGLDVVLSRMGNITLLAPLDGAFGNLQRALNISTAQLLASPSLPSLLAYHIVPGGALPSDTLQSGQRLLTVNGQRLSVTVADDAIYFDAAQVDTADIPASNGIMYDVKAVLIPADFMWDGAVIGAPAGPSTCPLAALDGVAGIADACAVPSLGCSLCVPSFAGALCASGLNSTAPGVLEACLRTFTPQLVAGGVPLAALEPAGCSTAAASLVSACSSLQVAASASGPAPAAAQLAAGCPASENISWGGLSAACANASNACTGCLGESCVRVASPRSKSKACHLNGTPLLSIQWRSRPACAPRGLTSPTCRPWPAARRATRPPSRAWACPWAPWPAATRRARRGPGPQTITRIMISMSSSVWIYS